MDLVRRVWPSAFFTVLSARNNAQFLLDNHLTSGEVTWGAIAGIGLGVFVILVETGFLPGVVATGSLAFSRGRVETKTARLFSIGRVFCFLGELPKLTEAELALPVALLTTVLRAVAGGARLARSPNRKGSACRS